MGKYLKKFETDSQYENYINGGGGSITQCKLMRSGE